MKIYRIASVPMEFLGNNPPPWNAEAIRLKDGRIFYCADINHYSVIAYLRHIKIDHTEFDAIGWLDKDGVWTTKHQGDNDIKAYMKSPGW